VRCQQGRAAKAAAEARRRQVKAAQQQEWQEYRQQHEGRMAPGRKAHIRRQLIGWAVAVFIVGGVASCTVAVDNHNNSVQDQQSYQQECQQFNDGTWLDHNDSIRECTDAP
jgi:hypothetical protein